MKKLLLVLVASFGFQTTFAQGVDNTNYLDATLGAGNYQGSLSLSYLHRWSLGKNQRLGISLGGRLTSYVGQNQYYSTAPAQLTSESSSPLILFKDNIVANMDTLLVKSPQVNALNLFINFDYSLSSKFQVGFNIDAIGFSFGSRKQANFINGNSGKITEASPSPFNILLISDNDRGTLNSELYVKYFFNQKWGLKAGGQFLFTEYTSKEKVQTYPEENDRFRNKSLLFCLGVTLKLE